MDRFLQGQEEASDELDFTAPGKSNQSETTVFLPGELSRLLAQGDRALASSVSQLTPAGPAAANRVAVIVWASGAATEFSAQLNIGRDPQFCPLATEMASETHVSRQHAVLEVCAEGVRVRDLGSRNGTFVNGERVPSGQVVLVDRGAQIRFSPHCVVRLTLKR